MAANRQHRTFYSEDAAALSLQSQIGGSREERLIFGRCDLLTERWVVEVEPYSRWTAGVMQVLAYAAQVKQEPCLALYGLVSVRDREPMMKMHAEAVRRRLDNLPFHVELLWHDALADKWVTEHAVHGPSVPTKPPPPRSALVGIIDNYKGAKLLITAGEAAELLKCPQDLIYQLMNKGAISSVHIGRLRRIPIGTLLNWLEEGGPDVERLRVRSTVEVV